jgi:phage gp36-like protein
MPNIYVTPAQMLTDLGTQLYGMLELVDGDSSYATSTRLLAAIESANDLIDAYLRDRYSLPLASVPALLRSHACALARWGLLAARPEAVQLDGIDRKLRDDAEAFLKSLANGTTRLDVSSAGAIAGGAELVQLRSTSEREGATSPSWVETF